MKQLGYHFLVKTFKLPVCDLLVKSYLTEEYQNKIDKRADVELRYYSDKRIVKSETWQENILFALKYEGVNLEVLKAFFKICDEGEISKFVQAVPTGSYHRRIWFFYEFLTGRKLDIPDVTRGNYVDAVDGDRQFALPDSSAVKERRYRVNNNLVGNSVFCPMVRYTDAIKSLPGNVLKKKSDDLLGRYPSELLYRAIQYLYVKETKSSFAIERETPTQKRTMAFVSLLKRISPNALDKEALLRVQNRVVDERYAQNDWRTSQVYVGETLSPAYEKVHFIAVKPNDVAEILNGFLAVAEKMLAVKDCDPVVVAAVLSFAFVFIHPFDDGNGRIHRYIMHYVLSRTGFAPDNLIFPVSAVLLKNQRLYDRMLETFSERVMRCLEYDSSPDGEVTVRGESLDFYRYIDFTPIVEEFQKVILETIETEWKCELDYLVCYDRMREGMREIVDMPDAKANLFIKIVNQNGGKLSKAKRDRFLELTDDEIARLENVVAREMLAARRVE